MFTIFLFFFCRLCQVSTHCLRVFFILFLNFSRFSVAVFFLRLFNSWDLFMHQTLSSLTFFVRLVSWFPIPYSNWNHANEINGWMCTITPIIRMFRFISKRNSKRPRGIRQQMKKKTFLLLTVFACNRVLSVCLVHHCPSKYAIHFEFTESTSILFIAKECWYDGVYGVCDGMHSLCIRIISKWIEFIFKNINVSTRHALKVSCKFII